MSVVDGKRALVAPQGLTGGLGLGVYILVHKALALAVHMQEVIALSAGLQVHACGMRIVLLHGRANPKCSLVHIARVDPLRNVETLVGRLQRPGIVRVHHVGIGRIVTGSQDDSLSIDLRVGAVFVLNNSAGYCTLVARANETQRLGVKHVLNAHAFANGLESRQNDVHAQTMRHTVEVHEVSRVIIEEVRDRPLGVIRTLEEVAPQRTVQALLLKLVLQPIHAGTRLVSKLPQVTLVKTALAPTNPVAHDLSVIHLVFGNIALIEDALNDFGTKCRNVGATARRLACLLDHGHLSTLLSCGNSSDGASKTAADDKNISAFFVIGSDVTGVLEPSGARLNRLALGTFDISQGGGSRASGNGGSNGTGNERAAVQFHSVPLTLEPSRSSPVGQDRL